MLTLKVIWEYGLPCWSGDFAKCDPNTPKTMETAITFDKFKLKIENWYQKIQKVDVYVLLLLGHFYLSQ